MATIALYAGKANQMPGLIREVSKTVTSFKEDLYTLKNKMLGINSSVCNVADVIDSIQTSTQLQDDKIASLEIFAQNSEEFIEDSDRIDEKVGEYVKKVKDAFYEKYSHLKPDCEKNFFEKLADAVQSVVEWCKENWDTIVTVLKAIGTVALIAGLYALSVFTGGTTAVIATLALKGAIVGAILGGAAGGISSAIGGGSIIKGIIDGAFGGAVSGAISGALSGAGGIIGNGATGGLLKFIQKAAPLMDKADKLFDAVDWLEIGMETFGIEHQWLDDLQSNELYQLGESGVDRADDLLGGADKVLKFKAENYVNMLNNVEIEKIVTDKIKLKPGKIAEKLIKETFGGINDYRDTEQNGVIDYEVSGIPRLQTLVVAY